MARSSHNTAGDTPSSASPGLCSPAARRPPTAASSSLRPFGQKRLPAGIGLSTASFAWERGPSNPIGRRSCWPNTGGVGSGPFAEPVASRHTAPIGNRGIRTQATRHINDTLHLHCLRAALSAFGDGAGKGAAGSGGWICAAAGGVCRLPLSGACEAGADAVPLRGWARRCALPLHVQPQGTAGELLAGVLMMHNDKRGVAFLGQPSEAHCDAARNRGGVVEDNEPERVAAQQQVGAPGAVIAGRRANDPQTPRGGERRPVSGGQRASGVDVCNPAFVYESTGDQRPREGGGAAAAASGDFGQPAAGHATAGEHGVERGDPRGHGIVHRGRGGNDGGDLGAEGGEGGHKTAAGGAGRRDG